MAVVAKLLLIAFIASPQTYHYEAGALTATFTVTVAHVPPNSVDRLAPITITALTDGRVIYDPQTFDTLARLTTGPAGDLLALQIDAWHGRTAFHLRQALTGDQVGAASVASCATEACDRIDIVRYGPATLTRVR